jgi:K+-sensing histidine kinase KdpD
VWATLLAVGGLLIYPFFGHVEGLNEAGYYSVLIVALLGVGIIAALPWNELVKRGWDLWVMYLWSFLDVLLVTGVVVTTGPEHRGMFTIYALTTIFFGAASYPVRAQVTLLFTTFAAYLGAIWFMGWSVPPGLMFIRMVLLASIAFLSSFLAGELTRQMKGLTEVRRESERRANLLAAVARSGREISSLDTNRVLAAVVDSAMALGFDAANFCFFEDEGRSYQVRYAKGLPNTLLHKTLSSDIGLPGRVLADRTTLVVEDYPSMSSAVPELVDEGFRVAIGTPVWSNRRIEAVLVAGSRTERSVMAPDIEAFEILANQAGRALENAKMFEDERQTAERLAELDRMKSDFLANVSHELRTPLTAIQGMGTTLSHHWGRMDDEKRQQLLGRVNANAASLNHIISTLLDFSQIEQGRLAKRSSALDMGMLSWETLERVRGLFSDHTIQEEIEEGLIVVGDPRLLERVIENLLSNAAKHTPGGSTISLRVLRDGEHVLVEVTDDGPGIPETELKHIGARFFRGGDTDTRGTRGVGLGLALANEVLELHGTALEVRSIMGQGSTFWFRIPLAARSIQTGEEVSGL